jgi:type IV pilus assembly protein PilA
MKTSLKANLIQHLIAKKEEGGFTLIELLVVIIIIGILSAIALPAFLNQANRARQSEAVTYVGSINRAQQAYYLEQTSFTEAIAALGLGIPEDTQNYAYEAKVTAAAGTTPTFVSNRAIPGAKAADGTITKKADAPVRAYVGGVSVAEVNPTEIDVPDESTPDPNDTKKVTVSETTTVAILCEALQPPVNGGADGEQLIKVTPQAGAATKVECPDGGDRDGYVLKS